VVNVSNEEYGDTEVTALVGATIIDGNGGAPIEDGVVVIEGKRISAVGDRSTAIPAHAKRISLGGKFIIPGFIAQPWLVTDFCYATTAVRYEGRFDELALEAAQIALKGGLTTVIDLIGPRDDLIKARTAIDEGRAIGSRIRLCGGWIGHDCGPLQTWAREALPPSMLARINSRWECNIGKPLTSMKPMEVREEIRKYIASGVDYLCVKVNGTYGAEESFNFSPRVLRAIVEEAHHAGLVVRGHCMYSEEGVWEAVDAGVDLPMAHLNNRRFSAETVELLAKRQITYLVYPFTREQMEFFQQVAVKAGGSMARTNAAAADFKPVNEQALLRAGVPVMFNFAGEVLTADSLNHPYKVLAKRDGWMGLDTHHFNVLLGAEYVGMKPMEILQASTRNVARAFKIDKDLGTLEKAKFADLLILDRNPLENAENFRSISVVMKEGQIIDRDALPTQKLLSAESNLYA
jgi:imidazolonepropionase-like amidohydrolase